MIPQGHLPNNMADVVAMDSTLVDRERELELAFTKMNIMNTVSLVLALPESEWGKQDWLTAAARDTAPSGGMAHIPLVAVNFLSSSQQIL